MPQMPNAAVITADHSERKLASMTYYFKNAKNGELFTTTTVASEKEAYKSAVRNLSRERRESEVVLIEAVANYK
jgi:DNA-binding transcriptional regulator YbjK